MNKNIILILTLCFSNLVANNKAETYLINPIETPHGILLTDNFESTLYLLNNGNLETLITAPGCGRYIQVSLNGNLVGLKLIDSKTHLQTPAIYNLESKSIIPLAEYVKNCGQVSFSVDGKIAYTIENELIIKNGNKLSKFDLGFYTNRATISPDGKSVIYSNTKDQLTVFDLETQSTSKITTGETEFYNAAWSSDNTMLAFQSIDAKIYLYDFKHETVSFIADGENPKWKSDSKSIVFFKKEIDFKNIELINSDIYESQIESKELSKITDTKNVFEMNPSYSLNGEILFQNYELNEISKINDQNNSEPIFKLNKNLEANVFYSNINIENPDAVKGLEQWQHIHQVLDSRDSGTWINDPVNGRHQGYLCCGATSAMEIIASYNLLPPDPIYTHGHTSQYGKYLSDSYTYNDYTYNNFTISPNGNPGFTSGAHGYMWNNGSPNSNAESFLQKHGINASYSSDITWSKVKAELDLEFPYMLCTTSLTDGHIVVAIGQYGDGTSLYCNDPYGDKNAGSYGSLLNGKNAIYDWADANTGHMKITPVVWGVTARYTRTLRIINSYPADNEYDVSTAVNPQINFYGEINPSSVGNNIQLFDEAGLSLNINYDLSHCADGSVSIIPTQKLKENSTYSIIIYNGIEGINGILSNQNTKITFTTGETFDVNGTILENFDSLNSWELTTSGVDANSTSINSTNEKVFSGSNSAKLEYKFTSSSGGYCRILNSSDLELTSHNNKSIGAWIFGDNSMHLLQYWFTNENGGLIMGLQESVNWVGWKFKTLDLATIENVISLNFNSIAIRQSSIGKSSGTIFFDELTLFNTPLGISAQSPANNEKNISVDASIVLEFNKPVDGTSIENAFLIYPEIAGSFSWNSDNTILTFKPTESFLAKTNYHVTIDTTASSLNGAKLNSIFTFTFETERKVLSLISSYPANNSTNISINADIILSFDGSISSLTLPGNVLFQDDNGNNVQISVDQSEYINGKIKFAPYSALSENSTYKIILSEKVGDTKGLKLNNKIEFSFTTELNKYVSGNVFDNFENNNGWSNPYDTEGSIGLDYLSTRFIISNAKIKAGSYSGKLEYIFLGIEALCRTSNDNLPKISSNQNFGLWVFGDNSKNVLEYWFINDNSVIEKTIVDTLNWTGWKLENISLSDVSNSDSLTLNSIVIRQADLGNNSGAVYFDDLQTDIVLPVKENPKNIPSKFVLEQNYPNPFNPSTVIKYSIPNAGKSEMSNVKLVVYDILGSKVATLVNEKQVAGNYEIKFDAANLSSGVYIYQLQSGGFLKSRKMVLLK
ncbi:MAG: Ig-like domain-containing protein [Bacteroidetes bacterium]|nr:Ig-like domain-containing protein [Bacteroidota bacterium]MBU1114926.1 Ig-like domain-containing protein [Bacteroidota bacterium]MBU1798681.1 Ig-like domain-containing protein [Bacteroidota bacterium]